MNGAFKDPKLVTKFEHRACVGQRLLSRGVYEQFHQDCGPGALVPCGPDIKLCDLSCGAWYPVEFIQYMGDASNVDAVQKEKVHVAQVACLIIRLTDVLDAEKVEKIRFSCTRSITDLQRIQYGTGDEFYQIVQREMQSVGAPTWLERSKAWHNPGPLPASHRLSIYLFGLDKGPDNQGGCRRIKLDLVDVPHIAFHAQWCLFH